MKASSEAARRWGAAASQRAMSWRVSASSMASAVSMQVWGMVVPGSALLGGAGLGEAVGVGAGLDDVAARPAHPNDASSASGTVQVACIPPAGCRYAVAGVLRDSGKAVVMPENDDRPVGHGGKLGRR